MSRNVRLLALSTVAVAALVASVGCVPAHGAETMPASGETLKLPPYRKTVLDNGVTLLLLEQHEVPIVSFNVSVRAGSHLDPAGKDGLASLTAELLRKGTKTRNADEIANAVDFVGGQLGFGAGQDRAVGFGEFMAKDVQTGIDLLADVLENPVFPEDEVKKLIAQRIDGIRQSKDQPQAVIGEYFNAYLFGAHPYGRPEDGDERTLATLTAADARSFHAARYGPRVTTVAAVGDFATADMEKRLADAFGGFAGAAVPPPPVADPKPSPGRRLLLVDKPDSTQTFFRIGNVGVSRTDPDRVPLDVVNTVFGGRFTSILNDALRINSGLTYGARSTFDERRVPGPFFISSYTQNETTVKAIDMALDLLGKLHAQGLSDEQLRSAKAYIKGQFPPKIETSDALAGLIATLDFHGLDASEIDRYFERVDAVTAADVKRVVKAHYPLDDLTFVLIGKASEVGAAVKKYAPKTERRSISDPGYR